ncbi:MAG: extracellular solute-binding protein [Armatimonadota bacterium]
MRRVLPLLLILLPVIAGLQAAWAGANMPKSVNDDKPITLVVFGLPNLADATSIAAKADMAVAQEFMRKYPNVKLQPFSFLKVPGSGAEGGSAIETDYYTLMAMASGTAPDVFTTNFRQSDTYIRQGFLLPLDEYYEKWKEESPEEVKAIFPPDKPALWEVAHRVGKVKQHGKVEEAEHTWAIPPDTLAMVMMYKKDILRKAGVNPEKPPQTWDEFYDMCIQVCDPPNGVWAYTMQGTWFMSWMLWSMGNDIIEKDANGEWKAAYNKHEKGKNDAVEAFRFAWKLVNGTWAICPTCEAHYEVPYESRTNDKLKVTCPDGHSYTIKQLNEKKMYFHTVCTDDYSLWGQNKLACMISYMGDMVLNTPGVDPTQIQLARIPTSPMGLNRAEINAKMYAINGTLDPVKDKGKIETAWAYIRFQCSEESKRIKTKVFVDGGYAKYLNPSWLRRFGYEAYLREVPPNWEAMFNQAMQEGRPEPYGKNAQMIYNEMDVAWGEVRLLKDPSDAAILKVLNKNVARTNERLMGDVNPKEEKRRTNVALVVVIITAILFILLMRYTMATYGQALASDSQRSRAAKRQLIVAWMVMMPALAAVVLFQYIPLVRGSLIAFQDYQIILGGTWTGLKNFGQVLFAPEFWSALSHSLVYAAWSLGLGFLAPVALALLLHEIPRGSLFFRIVYFLPSVTSGVVVMLLWTQMYEATSFGVFNQFLSALNQILPSFLHIPEQQFLHDPAKALFWVVLPGVWMATGPGCIIYLAALQQIPTEYYEAADVDGAGFFAKLWTITVPYLKPLLIINFVGACVGAMKSFEPILIMTGGGPAGATKVLGLELWQNAFIYLKYGYATAMGWILASLLIGFTMFQLRYLSKVQFRLAKSD